MYGLFIAILLCLVAAIAAHEIDRNSRYRDSLGGFWEASHTFCKRAGISRASILIDEDRDSAYILIEDGDEMLVNRAVEFTISPVWTGNLFARTHTYALNWDEPVDPLPQSCELRFDPAAGLIGLFEDGTLYLEAFRNARASAGVV